MFNEKKECCLAFLFFLRSFLKERHYLFAIISFNFLRSNLYGLTIELITAIYTTVYKHLCIKEVDKVSTDLLTLKKITMLRWTVTFIILALIAGVFGFGGIAAGAASIAKILFFIFIVLFIVSLIRGKKSV